MPLGVAGRLRSGVRGRRAGGAACLPATFGPAGLSAVPRLQGSRTHARGCTPLSFPAAAPATPAAQVISALEAAARAPKAPLSDMFTDVYAQVPWHLEAQRREVFAHVAGNPDACPSHIPVR